MNALVKKALTGAIGAIALAGAMAASSAPAQAGSRDAAWFAGGVVGGAIVSRKLARLSRLRIWLRVSGCVCPAVLARSASHV